MTGIDRLVSLYHTGGPVIALLLAMSVTALAIVIVKIAQSLFSGSHRLREARAAVRAFTAGDLDAAEAWASSARRPAADLIGRAIAGLREHETDEARLREEIARQGQDQLRRLRRGLRPLELIASLAPLLGLLGTVLGMIDAFQALERTGNTSDPAVLSAGIWQALSTTAVGLAVAIPAVAASTWLEARVQHLGEELDSLATELFTRRPAPLERQASE